MVTTSCVTTAAQTSPAVDSGVQSRFQRTVQSLQDASPELRGEFAAIALSRLAEAYVVEAQLARQQARAGGRKANLRSWSVAVDYYARQMPLLLEDIEIGLPVRLSIGDEKSTAITVADRIVILSHPRINQQSAFEQEILVEFCSRQRCQELAPVSAELEPIPVSTSQIRPDWSFTTQGPVCSYQGVKVRFKSEQNLANSRLICEQFLQELMTLTDEIAWQQRHGVSIDWDGLEIQSTPGKSQHIVRLNATGDSILVTIPVLYASVGLLKAVLPWIRQWLSKQQEASVELDAERYGWQKP